jgi:hypothetical protein
MAGSGGLAAGQLDGLDRVDDHDLGPRPQLGPPPEDVAVVAGDEGVVAGQQVRGQVLDVADFAPVGRSGPAGKEDVAEGGVRSSVLVVHDHVRTFHPRVIDPRRRGDAADERLAAQPLQVALVLVGRGGFLVDGERAGDP